MLDNDFSVKLNGCKKEGDSRFWIQRNSVLLSVQVLVKNEIACRNASIFDIMN